MQLNPAEQIRYSRQINLPEFGLKGQMRLKSAAVLIVGAGGLGSPAALYLAAAGVGRIGLVDPDQVELSNLHRQVLHATSTLKQLKVGSGGARLRDLNPEVTCTGHAERFTTGNAERLLADYDLVIDGSDNFATRYLVNDACVLFGKPLVYGSVFRFEGQASVFSALGGPCYRCIFPEAPAHDLSPNCAEGGVLGVLPGLIGVIQAAEAIKLLAGIGRPLVGRFLTVDARTMTFREHRLVRDVHCPVCGDHPSITCLREETSSCPPAVGDEMDAPSVAALLKQDSGLTLLDVREPHELAIARLEGAAEIPLGALPTRMGELDPDSTIVVLCHHGGRSARACRMLRQAGFSRVCNLTGGIDAWSCLVDATIARY